MYIIHTLNTHCFDHTHASVGSIAASEYNYVGSLKRVGVDEAHSIAHIVQQCSHSTHREGPHPDLGTKSVL